MDISNHLNVDEEPTSEDVEDEESLPPQQYKYSKDQWLSNNVNNNSNEAVEEISHKTAPNTLVNEDIGQSNIVESTRTSLIRHDRAAELQLQATWNRVKATLENTKSGCSEGDTLLSQWSDEELEAVVKIAGPDYMHQSLLRIAIKARAPKKKIKRLLEADKDGRTLYFADILQDLINK